MELNPSSLYLPRQVVDLPVRENSPVKALIPAYFLFHPNWTWNGMRLVDAVTRKSSVKLAAFYTAKVFSLTLHMTLHIPSLAFTPY